MGGKKRFEWISVLLRLTFPSFFKVLPKLLFLSVVCVMANVAIRSQFMKKNKTVALYLFYLSLFLSFFLFFTVSGTRK